MLPLVTVVHAPSAMKVMQPPTVEDIADGAVMVAIAAVPLT